MPLLHRGWEPARGSALQCLATERNTLVVAAMHVPQVAGRKLKPHVHLIASSRRILGSNCADFVTDLLGSDAKANTAKLRSDWCAAHARLPPCIHYYFNPGKHCLVMRNDIYWLKRNVSNAVLGSGKFWYHAPIDGL